MARGRLPEENPPALSPVVSQPDLFELRWKFVKEKNALVWAYHGEPGDPDVVVVCIHRKETDVPVVRQRELQNAMMEGGSDASLWESSAAGVTPRLALTASIRDRF